MFFILTKCFNADDADSHRHATAPEPRTPLSMIASTNPYSGDVIARFDALSARAANIKTVWTGPGGMTQHPRRLS